MNIQVAKTKDGTFAVYLKLQRGFLLLDLERVDELKVDNLTLEKVMEFELISNYVPNGDIMELWDYDDWKNLCGSPQKVS